MADPNLELVRALVDGDRAGEIVADIGRLERRLRALRERAMRRAIVLEEVSDMGPAELVAFMAHLLRRVREGRAEARSLMQELALEPLIFVELPYRRVEAAYRLAQDAGDPEVSRYFLSAARKMDLSDEEAYTGNEHLDLPLGLRRAAARTGDRFQLDRLVHDRDWRVIRLLLDNPRIVEHDVIKVAAMRPTRPEVLEQVASHRRWSGRYRVRKALAANSYTPSTVARRLLPTLMRQDLRQIVDAGVLEPDLHEEARAMLALGGRGRPVPRVGDDADLAALVAGLEAELGPVVEPRTIDGHPPGPPEGGVTSVPRKAVLRTTPEEDALLGELVAVMEATLDGRPGGVTLEPVDERDPPALCLIPVKGPGE